MADGLKEVRKSLQVNLELQHDTATHAHVERLAKCIDRGVEITAKSFRKIRRQVRDLRAVAKTLDPSTDCSKKRQATFDQLRERFDQKRDLVSQHMAGMMERFKVGLFAGGDDLDIPLDNLAQERWFKKPKSHSRRITGRRHAGVRIVQEGPTMMLALDAHVYHPHPFLLSELQPYYQAQIPEEQKAAMHRRKIMRKARSKKKLKLLLKDLELRYLTES